MVRVLWGAAEGRRGAGALGEAGGSRGRGTRPRALRRTVVRTFGDDVAPVAPGFGPVAAPAVTGRQSQTWLRTDAGWRVANAHVSWHSGERP